MPDDARHHVTQGARADTIDEIAEWVRQETRYRGSVDAATTLEEDLGVVGDDMEELLEAYRDRYGVDMRSYLWYFHTDEEGSSLGGLIFRSPSRRVPRIPITIAMLADFARSKSWSVEYPSHELPQKRWDVALDRLLFALAFLALLALWIWQNRR